MTAAIMLACGLPAAAQAPGLGVLDGIAPGQWKIANRDGAAKRLVCLKSGRDIVLLRHRGQDCRRIAIQNAPNAVTVQFSCRGRGYGRIAIRRETPALIQIEGQGISDGVPYEFKSEGRRVGACR